MKRARAASAPSRTDALVSRLLRLSYAALLASCASGCIEGILVEDQGGAITRLDGEVPVEEDAGSGEQEAGTEPLDAGSEPQLDAGSLPSPNADAGADAGRDAGEAAGDAGASQDSGCAGGRCDAGAPVLGPCASCGPSTLVGPAVSTDFAADCSNGSPKVCWSNPDGSCEMQCPKTDSCTRDHPGACGPGRYCHFARLDCGESSAGFCAPSPSECMASVVTPVCGCDGRVYQNPCFAAKDGATGVYYGLPETNCK